MQKSSVLFLTLYFNLLWVVLSRTRLTWVNGIGYGLQHMEDGKKEISKLFGGKAVSYCHNPTSMVDEEDFKGYIGDLTQAGTQLLGKITQEVNTLAKHLKEAVAAVGREGRVVHIAHSQGALLTALAAKQLSPLEMSQIEVLGMHQNTLCCNFLVCVCVATHSCFSSISSLFGL